MFYPNRGRRVVYIAGEPMRAAMRRTSSRAPGLWTNSTRSRGGGNYGLRGIRLRIGGGKGEIRVWARRDVATELTVAVTAAWMVGV